MQFKELGLIEPILKALQEQNYTEPTSIQEKAIPLVLQHHDVLASAQTGTGKTAAFSIPIIQNIFLRREGNNNSRHIKALILTPTRELAIQIGENISTYAKHTGIKNTVIFGGVNQHGQVETIRKGVDILIATPGRLLDLMNQRLVSIKDIEFFVLDEADRMLDMGFINDIKKVIAQIPVKRQTLFFSATLPDNIVELSNRILNNPKKVEVSPVSSTAHTIQQFMYFTNKDSKKALLSHLLEDKAMDQVLLFCKTKHGADKIVLNLKKENISSAAIHGDKAQNQRQKALNQFKDKQVRVLVATDIAARGIDIDKLKYVINYDIPNQSETYVHRIGRSGRAGEEGIAISICEPEENDFVKDIEKLIKLKIDVVTNHPFPQTDAPMNAAQKKEVEKQKQKNKQLFFEAKRKKEGRSR
jgi:ATP-dependent RNA helicase RhlE